MQSFTADVQLLEDFVWGKYTEGIAQPLKDWEKSSALQQYIKLVYKLHHKQVLSKDESDLLESWMSSRRHGEYLNVLLKYCLQQIDGEQNEERKKKLIQEFNDQFLHFSFDHERDARGVIGSQISTEATTTASSKQAPKGRNAQTTSQNGLKVSLSTEEQNKMSTKQLSKLIESDKTYYDWDLRSADQSFIKQLDLYSMESHHRIAVALETLEDFAYCKDIYSVLKRYKKMMRQDNKYFTLPEHYFNKMTLQQLEDMDSDSNASESSNFQTLRYVARHHSDLLIISKAGANLLDKRAALQNLIRVADKKCIRVAATEALLINGYEQGLYDYEVLFKFLDNPSQHISHFTEKMCRRTYSDIYLGKQIVRYKASIVSAIDIDKIVHLHVKEYVKDEKTMKTMTSYFDKFFLQGLLIKNKALAGGSLTEFREWYGAGETDTFENLKILEFNKLTKRVFKRKEPVEVFLNLKNIHTLKVKIFQLDTVHLYRGQQVTSYETLDLDGLIARDVLDFTFGYPKQQQFVHKINFPDIQARDQCVFILEFVGGTNSIRLVVRKGTLQLFPTEHFQGIAYKILDEEKQICKGDGSGIFVDSRFYPTDSEGKVLFPFGTEKTENKKVVVVHRGFASECTLSVPEEHYSLRSTLIANEEGLVCDQVNRLVLRNRLFLNDTPITLKKATECFVTVETHNFQNFKGFREFKGLVLSDEEDLVLELPTPKLLSHLQVAIHVRFKDLRGREVKLQKIHTVEVDRNHKADTLCTVHLRSSLAEKTNRKTYMLQVLGKNGEPIPDHRIRVQLLKSYGVYDFELTLFTDKNGMAYIGDVDHLKFITAECPNGLFKKRLFTIPDDYEAMDIPSVIEMVVGEKFVLPALSRKISRDVFEFFKVGQHPYQPGSQMLLNDCFELLKPDADSVVAGGLLPGDYIFRYNLYPCRQVNIRVHEGVRWQSNPFVLEKSKALTELRPESRFLSISSISRTDSLLSVGLHSNSPNSSLRAHILGYHYRPTLKERLSQELLCSSPDFSSRTTQIPSVENTLLEDRVLSDELSYVFERRTKERLVGNTLDKPSILLHREKVRETTEDQEILREGKGFQADQFAKHADEKLAEEEEMMQDIRKNMPGSGRIQRAQMELCEAKEYSFNKKSLFTRGGRALADADGKTGFWKGLVQGIFGSGNDFPGVDHSQRPRLEIRNATLPDKDIILNNMDFSQNSGEVLVNLKPDSSGSIHIPVEKLKGFGFLVLVLCDLHSTLVVEMHQKTGQVLKREMRPQEIMKAKQILQVNYSVHMSDDRHKVEVTGVQGAQAAIIEDLESLRESLLCLADGGVDKQELGDWTFLSKWASLSQEEKQSKWDKYGGSELAVFTFLRDLNFFKQQIQPLLKSKVQHNFIDKLLASYDPNLDAKLDWSELSNIKTLPSLSSIELLLLFLLSPVDSSDLRQNLLRFVESKVNIHPTDTSDIKSTWESLLNRSTNQDDDLDQSSVPEESLKKESKMEAHTPISSGKKQAPSKPALLDSLMECGESVNAKNKGKQAQMESRIIGKSMSVAPECDGDPESGFVKIEDVEHPIIIEEYKKAPLATEFRERQYYFAGDYPNLRLNKHWLKVYEHITTQRSKGKSPSELLNPETWGIVSEELLFMTNSTAEIIAALTIAPLAMKKSRITALEVSSTAVRYQGLQPYFALLKSSKIDSTSEPLELDIVVAQKFYDPQDKHLYDEKDPKIFTIKEITEFLTAKIYESRVSVSNLSESSCNLELHTQVPEGALPVYELEDFATSTKTLNPMETKMFYFKFYFPVAGEFGIYPATVTKNNRFITCARLGKDSLTGFKLKVVNDYKPENKPLETLQDMISFGGAEDILKFMADKNLFNGNLFDISKIRWVAKSSKSNFQKLVALLRKNFIFDQAIWAYSIHHGCYGEFNELMSVIAETFVTSCHYLSLSHGITIERFSPLEYDPLVNPRAHEIQQKGVNIRNQAFRETYTKFLVYCCEKVVLSQEDKVVFLAYLILQDRITDAQELLGKLNFQAIYQRGYCTIQLDYIRAYLCMYKEAPEFRTARDLSAKYKDFADLSWRERFLKISKQLEEYDRGRVIQTEREQPGGVQTRSNKELAEKAEFLKIEQTSGQGVHIIYKNVDRMRVRFYKFDMELLFSMDPFQESRSKGVESVQANKELKFRVIKADEFKTSVVPIPEDLASATFMVQVSAIDKFDVTEVYRSNLNAHVETDFGLVRVFDPAGKPLSACYVKCFSRSKGAKPTFYKDGYTDFRGSFDYASLNSDGLGNIEEFSILVISEEHGCKILRAKPPSPVGRLINSTSTDDQSLLEEVTEKFLDSYHNHLFRSEKVVDLV